MGWFSMFYALVLHFFSFTQSQLILKGNFNQEKKIVFKSYYSLIFFIRLTTFIKSLLKSNQLFRNYIQLRFPLAHTSMHTHTIHTQGREGIGSSDIHQARLKNRKPCFMAHNINLLYTNITISIMNILVPEGVDQKGCSGRQIKSNV